MAVLCFSCSWLFIFMLDGVAEAKCFYLNLSALSHIVAWIRLTPEQTVQQACTDRKGTKIEIDMEQSNKNKQRG